MHFPRVRPWLIVTALLMMGASCQMSGGHVAGHPGFHRDYSVARGALEKGNYKRAIRAYKNMLKTHGNSPLQARLRLEYAHSLLRAGQYPQAAGQAGMLVASEQGAARASAQAVQGTAEHEMALAAMQRGDFGPQVEARLKNARNALKAMLKTHKSLDPLGSMAQRVSMIGGDLARVKSYRRAGG